MKTLKETIASILVEGDVLTVPSKKEFNDFVDMLEDDYSIAVDDSTREIWVYSLKDKKGVMDAARSHHLKVSVTVVDYTDIQNWIDDKDIQDSATYNEETKTWEIAESLKGEYEDLVFIEKEKVKFIKGY